MLIHLMKNKNPTFLIPDHDFSLANAAAPFDALLERKSWNYFTLNTSFNNWCSRVKRPAASQIEGRQNHVTLKNRTENMQIIYFKEHNNG